MYPKVTVNEVVYSRIGCKRRAIDDTIFIQLSPRDRAPKRRYAYDNCESSQPISGVPAPDTIDWNHDDGKVRKRNQVAVHRLQFDFVVGVFILFFSLSLSLFLFSRHKRTRQLHGGPWPGNCNWDSEISLSVSIRLVLIPLVGSRYPSSRLPSLGKMKQNERKKREWERERERKWGWKRETREIADFPRFTLRRGIGDRFAASVRNSVHSGSEICLNIIFFFSRERETLRIRCKNL